MQLEIKRRTATLRGHVKAMWASVSEHRATERALRRASKDMLARISLGTVFLGGALVGGSEIARVMPAVGEVGLILIFGGVCGMGVIFLRELVFPQDMVAIRPLGWPESHPTIRVTSLIETPNMRVQVHDWFGTDGKSDPNQPLSYLVWPNGLTEKPFAIGETEEIVIGQQRDFWMFQCNCDGQERRRLRSNPETVHVGGYEEVPFVFCLRFTATGAGGYQDVWVRYESIYGTLPHHHFTAGGTSILSRDPRL